MSEKPKSVLVFDTETTGLWYNDLDDLHERQPRIVQLGAILYGPDRSIRGQLDVIFKPEGWVIPDAAAQVHGITQEIALRYGVNWQDGLMLFSQLHAQADICVAHNLEFDQTAINCQVIRMGKPTLFQHKEHFCTMRAMTPLCKIDKPDWQKRKYPNDPYKWPNLQEAYLHAFGYRFDGAHSAIADVQACAKLYWWLQDGAQPPCPVCQALSQLTVRDGMICPKTETPVTAPHIQAMVQHSQELFIKQGEIFPESKETVVASHPVSIGKTIPGVPSDVPPPQ